MSDAAQGEPRKHEVFSSPYKVEPKFESWKTPSVYRMYPGGKELPDELKVWRIQGSGKSYGGVVSFSYGFEDSPDAEILTPGFNTGKESGAVGVGRHGNILQWGFSEPPSRMTEAGRCFFLNCIHYVRKFDGFAPLVRTESSDRLNAVRLALLLNRIKDPNWHKGTFPPELLEKFKNDPEGLSKYYQDRIEVIYRDRVFRVDEELTGLGLKSNRSLETLRRLIAMADEPSKGEVARKLLARYTTQSFATTAEWRGWLDKSQARIYFSDVGGFKFRVAPEKYPVRPGSLL